MKMFRLLMVAVAMMVLRPAVVEACSCVMGPADNNFFMSLDYLWHNWPVPGMVIVKGRIERPEGGYGTQLRILYSYKGSVDMDTVTVWGDAGADCRLTLHVAFNIGDTIIAALWHTNERLPAEKPEDYFVSSCGYQYLLVKGDKVYGGNYQSFTYPGYPLKDFEDSLKGKIDSLNGPPPVPTSVAGVEANSLGAKLHPNPAGGKVVLQWQQKEASAVRMVLMDVSGRVVWAKENDFYSSGAHETAIELGGMTNGTYFIQISCNNQRQVMRLSVLH